MTLQFPGIDIIHKRLDALPDQLYKKDDLGLLIDSIKKIAPCYDYRKQIIECLDEPNNKILKKLFEQEDYKAFFNKAKKILPEHLYEYFRALALFREKDYEKSLAIVENLIQQNYYHHNFFELKAKIYDLQNNLAEAEKNLILSVFASYGFSDTFYNYGVFLLNKGDAYNAMRAFEEVLFREPTHELAATILGMIKREIFIAEYKRLDQSVHDKYKANGLGFLRMVNKVTRNLFLTSYTMRERIQRLINKFDPKTINIMGAGNCDNFNINVMADKLEKIRLVDIDKYALGYARRFQQLKDKKNVIFRFDLDFSGVIDDMFFWSKECPSDEEIYTVLDKMKEHDLGLTGQYDMSISDCVLHSMLTYIELKLGVSHPLFSKFWDAFIEKHVEQLLDSTRSGGQALLITEIMSSEQQEFLLSMTQGTLNRTELDLAQHMGSMSPMTNILFLKEKLEYSSILHRKINAIHIVKPWIWHFPGINYLVSALVIEKN